MSTKLTNENGDSENFLWMLKAEMEMTSFNEGDTIEEIPNQTETLKKDSSLLFAEVSTDARSQVKTAIEKSEFIIKINTTDVKHFKEIFDKNKEVLRKLRLVKSHKVKKNLKTLNELILKWRQASQRALQELLVCSPKEPHTTMLKIIQHLAIDSSIIKFDLTTQSFPNLKNNMEPGKLCK